jgi:hypothetical protein
VEEALGISRSSPSIWQKINTSAATTRWDHVQPAIVAGQRPSPDSGTPQVLAALLSSADAAGVVSWDASVDSTIIRAHQHAANLKRPTEGRVELQESAGRAR